MQPIQSLLQFPAKLIPYKSRNSCIQPNCVSAISAFRKFFLPTYGFLVSMGVLLGLWISVRNSERLGIDGDKAWNFGILVVLSGIIGAKVLYIINEWGYYSAHPSKFSA